MPSRPPASHHADVIVVGPGAAGATMAIALARHGFATLLIGPPQLRPNARTVALLEGSIALYRALGLWDALEPLGAPLRTIRLIDDTDSLFRPPPVAFDAKEIGLEAFGYNIESHRIVGALLDAVRQTPGLVHLEAQATHFDYGPAGARVRLEDGSECAAPLVIAGDGHHSPARSAAGIGVREMPYRQSALTALLAHRLPHRSVSTEFHTRAGPFTLVPLRGSETAPHRSSLVWLMTPAQALRHRGLADADLALAIERQAGSMLGAMRIEGPRGLFPMVSMTAQRLVGPRLALIGEAAHVLPPIGAQGLNLGLRDVAHLFDQILAARARREDLGGPEVLAAYEARRRGDVLSRGLAIDVLNRSLLSDLLPADFLRGAGLLALASIGPLRRALMRRGVAEAGDRPNWLRPYALDAGGAALR